MNDALEGSCEDSNGNSYNWVEKYPTTVEECAEFCQGLPQVDGQVGMKLTSSYCYCLYSGHIPTTGLPADVTNTGDGFSGSGPVAGVQSSSQWSCYPLKVSEQKDFFIIDHESKIVTFMFQITISNIYHLFILFYRTHNIHSHHIAHP